MSTITFLSKFLNDNTGSTLLLLGILFVIIEYRKVRILKKQHKKNSKIDIINPETLEREQELYGLMSAYNLENFDNDEDVRRIFIEIKDFIIEHNLYLHTKTAKIGNEFADHILESHDNRDKIKEGELLENFKKHFRS
ncbi:hypothetical protein [Aquimarina sp. AU119]|uniref:hypothetical protein n=1 Tax=Aquimarina sp. AU119 TaxID=2108528 RepID=UPI000D69F00E|nr:hypothetical protein [Aquimarina sp. AU119]